MIQKPVFWTEKERRPEMTMGQAEEKGNHRERDLVFKVLKENHQKIPFLLVTSVRCV
jgi:hypothetical protein